MPRKSKELTASCYIRVDGVYHPVEDFNDELLEEMWIEMEMRAMRALGYEPVSDTETA